MALQPVNRRSVPDEVFDQLITEVTSGELAAGSPLPSERRLAEVLGVSRPAVREALQRLAGAGLVDIRQGDTTTVNDFRRFGGLDLLPRLLVARGGIDLTVARSILEARLLIAPKIAEYAAQRGKPDLSEQVEALAAATDPVERQLRALDFWEVVVDGAESIAFRLMFNGIRGAYLPAVEMLAPIFAVEVDRVDAYASLAKAIQAGSSGRAKRLAEDLLGPLTDSLQVMINSLEKDA